MKNFKLRVSLFRIWFVKNIVLFLEIIGITLFILVFTGVLPESTPIFGPLIIEIRNAEGDASGWVKVLSVFTTCMASTSLFLTKVKSIALSDIKSNKLKMSLVNANMYFNEKGRLVKKIEKATNTDIDSDGKIDEKESEVSEDGGISNIRVATNLFTGIKNAVSDFFAIATIKLDDDEEKAEEQAKKVISDRNLTDAAEAVNEIDDTRAELFNKKVDNAVDEATDELVGDVKASDNISNIDKEDTISLLGRFNLWLKKMFHIERKTPEEKAAIKEAKKKEKLAKKQAKEATKKQKEAEKQIASDKKEAEQKKKEEVKIEPKKEEKQVKEIKEEKKEIKETKVENSPSRDPVNSFLAGLRNK